MMQQLRNSTKWIMILVALAFVGLMVFEWGMDISGRSTGSQGEIGRVNGTPVPYEAYQATYRNPLRADGVLSGGPHHERAELADRRPGVGPGRDVHSHCAGTRAPRDRRHRRRTAQRGPLQPPAGTHAGPGSPEPMASSTSPGTRSGSPARLRTCCCDWRPSTVKSSRAASWRARSARASTCRTTNCGTSTARRTKTASVSSVSFEPLTRVAEDQIEITPGEVSDYYRGKPRILLHPGRRDGRVGARDQGPHPGRYRRGAGQGRGTPAVDP